MEDGRLERVTFGGALASADLDADGAPDLTTGAVQTFLNLGDGRFAPLGTYLDGQDALFHGSVGDLTGDGLPDILAFVPQEEGGIWVTALLVNVGDGGFAEPVLRPFTTAPGRSIVDGRPEPRAASLGDLDGDGDLDAVIVRETFTTVVLNNGDGSFSEPTRIRSGRDPHDVALRDLDGDGHLDAAISVGMFPTVGPMVSVHRGNGDGTFGNRMAYGVGDGVYPSEFITIEDIDGDAVLDLVTGNASRHVSVFRGFGDGAFDEAETYGVPGHGWDENLALGDFDGDGDIDIAHPIFRQGVALLSNQSVR